MEDSIGAVSIWLAQKIVELVLETFKPQIQEALRRWLRH